MTVTLTPLGFLAVFVEVLFALAVGEVGAGLLFLLLAADTVLAFSLDFLSEAGVDAICAWQVMTAKNRLLKHTRQN